MIRRAITFATIVLCMSKLTYGQQDPQFTQYMYNQVVFNPAFAGSIVEQNHNMFQAALYHRNQWAGSIRPSSDPNIRGFYQSPVTQTLTLNSPLAVDDDQVEKLGGMLSIVNDQLGYITNRSLNVGGSYHISLHSESYRNYEYKNLYFGLSAGVKQFEINYNENLDPSESGDPVVPTSNLTTFTPDIGFGVLFKTDGYFIGASAPHLLETSIAFNDSSLSTQSRHYYLTGAFTFMRNKNFTVTPNILAKYVVGAPPQLNFNITGALMNNVWLGFSYRTDDAVGVMFGVNMVDALSDTWSSKGGKMMLGYAMDYNTSGISNINGITHEVMLEMNFSIEKNRSGKFIR